MSAGLKPRDAIKSLLDVGYVEVNVRGGRHRKFYHVGSKHWIALPYSPKGDTYYGHMAHNVRMAVGKTRQHGE